MGSPDSSVTSKRHSGFGSSEAVISRIMSQHSCEASCRASSAQGKNDYVLVCVLATADLKAKPWHPRHPKAVGPVCLFGGGHALIKCNADSACLPPNDVAALIAALDIDDKIE
jgi:hypothetical protein